MEKLRVLGFVLVNIFSVIPHPSAQCVPNEPIAVPHKTGYLAPHTNLGSHTCPFRLTTEDGQHFDIKLFSFLK